MELPNEFQINAYDPGGEAENRSSVPAETDLWALRNKPDTLDFLASEEPADKRDWANPDVGWGLIVPENPECRGKDSAQLADFAGDPILDLWKFRGSGRVFYDSNRPDRLSLIWSANDQDNVLLSASPVGNAPGALPRYLLICGSPDEIGWELQYVLHRNTNCYVGRLPFRGPAAKNYVYAVLNDFRDCGTKKQSAVVWAATWDEEGESGITRLMRDVVGHAVYARIKEKDKEVTPLFLDGLENEASVSRLLEELEERHPAFLLNTSHGQTGPLASEAALRASLGLPLDQDKEPITLEVLRQAWSLGGAIWFAHACCSAGSDAHTNFEDLFEPDSGPDRIIKRVAQLGSSVAPLPLRLLQLEKPLRAFIGHVEPTSNFALSYPYNPTPLGVPGSIATTSALGEALYDRLYRKKPEPVGLALRSFYDRIGGLDGTYNENLREYNKGRDKEMTPFLVWSRLSANDIKTTVILGDPAVSLPV